MRTLLVALVATVLLLAVIGCGASLGGGPEPTGAGETHPASTGPVRGGATASQKATDGLSAGRVETCEGGTIRLNAREKKTVELHNATREERGLTPLCVHPALTAAARTHSRKMIRKDYFSHDSYEGTPLVERLRRHGYTTDGYRSWRVAGNIAWGNRSRGTPEHVFGGWMNSDSHRPNILSEEFRQIGVGTYTGKYESYRDATAYTVEFGVRRQ